VLSRLGCGITMSCACYDNKEDALCATLVALRFYLVDSVSDCSTTTSFSSSTTVVCYSDSDPTTSNDHTEHHHNLAAAWI
jgi:hypothetical protein